MRCNMLILRVSFLDFLSGASCMLAQTHVMRMELVHAPATARQLESEPFRLKPLGLLNQVRFHGISAR